MSVTALTPTRLALTEETAREAERTTIPDGAVLAIQTADGKVQPLEEGVQQMLIKSLEAFVKHGKVNIAHMPDNLTSTATADILDVSRPTLMKWARAGKIRSFKKGSHTRFYTDEILRLRETREERPKEVVRGSRSFTARYSGIQSD